MRCLPARAREGYTLIETVMASALIALALVPALALVRDSMAVGRTLDDANMAETLCVSKLEEHLALGAALFTDATVSGNFASEGYANFRYTVVRSQQTAAGGSPDELMAVTTTVWHDADGDATQDTGETSVTLATKIAKMAVYQDGAGTAS